MITFIFRSKGYEVLFEAFPQVILGAFTIQALQLWEPLNIISFFISLFGLTIGLGDFLALCKVGSHDNELIDSLWGSLSVFIDVVLRCIILW